VTSGEIGRRLSSAGDGGGVVPGTADRREVTMTASQSQAIWELCRQGFPLSADEAADRWEKGEPYEPDSRVRVTREISRLIECANREVDERGSFA
jgi:hypothetical protein